MLHAPRRPGNVIVRPNVRNRYLLEFHHAGVWEALDVVLSPTAEEAAIHPAFWVAPADGGVLGLPIRVSRHGETLLEGVATVYHIPGVMRATTGVLVLPSSKLLCLWGESTPESYLSDFNVWEDAADGERLDPPTHEKLRQSRDWDRRFAPKRVAAAVAV